jgi:hypothetical protein
MSKKCFLNGNSQDAIFSCAGFLDTETLEILDPKSNTGESSLEP